MGVVWVDSEEFSAQKCTGWEGEKEKKKEVRVKKLWFCGVRGFICVWRGQADS